MKKTKKRVAFVHLREKHRDRIHALYGEGHNQKSVAEVLGVAPSTISRELKRYGKKTWRYSATRAEKDAQEKRTHSKCAGMKVEAYPELKERIIRELKELRAPDEIAGRMKKENLAVRIGTNALYKWLYSVWGQPYCRYLCTKRYRRKKQKQTMKREMIPDRISLKQRPKRGEHAEGDLFVSPIKIGVQRSGALICVSSVQLLAGRMIENKKPATMARAVSVRFVPVSPSGTG